MRLLLLVTAQIRPVHRELDVTTGTCHALIVCLVALNLESLVILIFPPRRARPSLLLLVFDLAAFAPNNSPTVRSLRCRIA